MQKLILSILVLFAIKANSQNVKISDMTAATDLNSATLPIIQGGTNKKAAISLFDTRFGGTATPTANTNSQWDANKNFSANNSLITSTSTATAAGTTTLTVSSTRDQYFTGTTTQTCVLPVATTLATNQEFWIYNNSTGSVTVTTSGGNTLATMVSNSILHVICTNTSGGTGLASWTYPYYTANVMTGVGDQIQGGASGVPTRVASVATGKAWLSGGVGSSSLWGQVDLTTTVTGLLPLTNGGTNATLTANTGGIVYSSASALAILSGTATASKMLLSGSTAAPTWSTSTIPTSSGTALKWLRSDGTNYILSTSTLAEGGVTAGKTLTSDGTNWVASAPSINTTSGDAATINAPAGRFRKDNSGTTFTLTNSYITANSIITLTVITAGLTGGKYLTVQAGSGSATITFEDNTTGIATAPSADMDVNFKIQN